MGSFHQSKLDYFVFVQLSIHVVILTHILPMHLKYKELKNNFQNYFSHCGSLHGSASDWKMARCCGWEVLRTPLPAPTTVNLSHTSLSIHNSFLNWDISSGLRKVGRNGCLNSTDNSGTSDQCHSSVCVFTSMSIYPSSCSSKSLDKSSNTQAWLESQTHRLQIKKTPNSYFPSSSTNASRVTIPKTHPFHLNQGNTPGGRQGTSGYGWTT